VLHCSLWEKLILKRNQLNLPEEVRGLHYFSQVVNLEREGQRKRREERREGEEQRREGEEQRREERREEQRREGEEQRREERREEQG